MQQGLRISITKRFLYFGRNSSMHGLRHLFRENANELARLFWLVVLMTSAWCLYFLLVPVVELGSVINFTLDTHYLQWTTAFPAVTVCETFTNKLVLKKFTNLYPNLLKPLNYSHQRYLTDQLYGWGSCHHSCCTPCGEKVSCEIPWQEIIKKVHKECDELLAECSFNGVNFSCCTHFLTVDSEHGPCFAFNTLQHRKPRELISVNRTTGLGVLSFRLLEDAQISLHSPEELATNNLDDKLKVKLQTRVENRADVLFSVAEIESEPSLRHVNIKNRACRYLDEVLEEPFHTYSVYSYGACRLAYTTEDSYKRCGCVHPVRDLSYKKTYCNYSGLNCLATYEDEKTKLSMSYVNSADSCLPSCEESEVTLIHVSNYRVLEDTGKGILVNLRMNSLPSLRFQRNLIRDKLDLVVSVGGIVGLFFSASILSLVEIIYLILRITSHQSTK